MSNDDQLRDIAGKVLSGPALDSFVAHSLMSAFTDESGEIDRDMVMGHLTAIHLAGQPAGAPCGDNARAELAKRFGVKSSPPAPIQGPGDSARAALSKRFPAANDKDTQMHNQAPAPRAVSLEISYANRPLDSDEAAALVLKRRPIDAGFLPRTPTVTGDNVPASSRPYLNQTLDRATADAIARGRARPRTTPDDVGADVHDLDHKTRKARYAQELAALKAEYGKNDPEPGEALLIGPHLRRVQRQREEAPLKVNESESGESEG